MQVEAREFLNGCREFKVLLRVSVGEKSRLTIHSISEFNFLLNYFVLLWMLVCTIVAIDAENLLVYNSK